MNTLPLLIQAHMTEVYLIYGMAFLFLAAAIYLQPKDNSVLPFSTILVWLAGWLAGWLASESCMVLRNFNSHGS